jgi:uncharacterized protein
VAEERHRFLPQRASIDAYGAGGFRFAGMSHRGSLLALPSGMHAWPPVSAVDLREDDFDIVLAEAEAIEFLLLGTGENLVPLPAPLAQRLRDHRIMTEVTPTGPAIRTWNVLLAEDRRVAAALLAVS